MRLPRFRLRTLMVAVAMSAPMLLWGKGTLTDRQSRFRAIADAHAEWASDLEWRLWPPKVVAIPTGKVWWNPVCCPSDGFIRRAEALSRIDDELKRKPASRTRYLKVWS